MTNREMLIELLSGKVPDDGGSYENYFFRYHISCPYLEGDKRCMCKDLGLYDDIPDEMCFECKITWLESEVYE